jgi:membrane protein
MKKPTGNIFIDLWDVLKTSVIAWNDSDPFRQSAIVAFYSIFSLPALLFITVTIAGYIWGEQAVQGKISEEIGSMIGNDAARMVEVMVASAVEQEGSLLMFYVGLGILLFGSTTVFYHLQKSLNKVWGVEPQPEKMWLKYIRDRVFSFGVVLIMGFLMLISLVLTSFLAAMNNWLQEMVPDILMFLFHFVTILISLTMISVLFALMFRYLPDVRVSWKPIWIGSILTAVLFEIGKYALSIYFGEADPASAYGSAGAIVLILLWVSYVCLILFFGAEFIFHWARKFGYQIKPTKNAKIGVPQKD